MSDGSNLTVLAANLIHQDRCEPCSPYSFVFPIPSVLPVLESELSGFILRRISSSFISSFEEMISFLSKEVYGNDYSYHQDYWLWHSPISGRCATLRAPVLCTDATRFLFFSVFSASD